MSPGRDGEVKDSEPAMIYLSRPTSSFYNLFRIYIYTGALPCCEEETDLGRGSGSRRGVGEWRRRGGGAIDYDVPVSRAFSSQSL